MSARRQRVLIALVEVLALCVWFVASAILPAVREHWSLSAGTAAWLIAMVQIGFVVGAILSAAFNVADRLPPHRIMAVCAAAAALCTALTPVAPTASIAFALRFMTGFALAGVYPVGMYLMASWSARAERGRAFGLLLAALTLGSGLPHLIRSFSGLSWEVVVWVSAACAGLAALISGAFIRPGPEQQEGPVKLRPSAAVRMLRDREVRWVDYGYFGHMWELYAWWAWVPLFLLATRGRDQATSIDSLTTFAVIGLAGAVGCLAGGRLADRVGRPRAAGLALLISGACCLLSPLFFDAPQLLLVVLLSVWGAAVIADSGIFSVALSEAAPADMVGTALALQTAVGLTLTNVTMVLVPWAGNLWGWQWALLVLAPGPAAGAVAMLRLDRLQRTRSRNNTSAENPLTPSAMM